LETEDEYVKQQWDSYSSTTPANHVPRDQSAFGRPGGRHDAGLQASNRALLQAQPVEPKRGKPLFKMFMNINDFRHGPFEVFEGDNPEDLAYQLCRNEDLEPEAFKKCVKVISAYFDQMSKFLFGNTKKVSMANQINQMSCCSRTRLDSVTSCR
jgi:hypothetical protein